MPKNIVIAALVAVITVLGAGLAAFGQSNTATVEVRVWQHLDDAESLYISARPEGGSWRDLGTVPLPLDDGISRNGHYRYGNIDVVVPLPEAPAWPTSTPSPTPTTTPSATVTPSPTATVSPVAHVEGYERPVATVSPTTTPTSTCPRADEVNWYATGERTRTVPDGCRSLFPTCAAAREYGYANIVEHEKDLFGIKARDPDGDGLYCES